MGLEVIGIRHRFGEREALAGVDMTVQPGVLTGLLGPNGAGKTTLIRVLLGVIAPDAGEVRVDGRPVTQADRRRWGYMPQERGLYPAMPAGEQLVYMARVHGVPRDEAEHRARELLAELGLASRWGDRTDKLSGGMQQRLQLGAALVHEPQVIVLDEPFSGLDPVAVEELAVTLRDRVDRGCTILLSSHQLDLVQDLCSEIVMVDRGRTVLRGSVAELRAGSGGRQLRLGFRTAPTNGWLSAFPEVSVLEQDAAAMRLSIPAGVDPLALLDSARAAGVVTDFGLDIPTLSQLFMMHVDTVNKEDL